MILAIILIATCVTLLTIVVVLAVVWYNRLKNIGSAFSMHYPRPNRSNK